MSINGKNMVHFGFGLKLAYIEAMFSRVLVFLFFFLQIQSATAFSPVCSAVLNPEAVYDNIKQAVNRHTYSRDLTSEQRAYIDYLASRLEQRVNRFDQAYNRILTPYGTEFLPRLREKLESMSHEFRRDNWRVINELRRYLGDDNLRYRDLNILQSVSALKLSAANRFIHNASEVYFGLDFFISTIDVNYRQEWGGFLTRREAVKLSGYQIHTPSISRELGSQVRTLEEESANDVYPGTHIPSLQVLEDDGLPFSGFPLTEKFLGFLKDHGDQEGHINIAAIPVLDEDPSLLNQLGIDRRTRHVVVEQVSRYDYENNNYFAIKNENSVDYLGFYDEGGYEFDQYGVLQVPGVRVILNKISRMRQVLPFRSREPELIVSDEGTLSAYPNRHEFFVALIAKAHAGD